MDAPDIIALVISICALGLTLYQGYQMRVSNEHLLTTWKEQTYQGFVNTWFETGKIFIEHPELRKYFYEGAELVLPVNDPEYHRAMEVAIFLDDAFRYTESQSESIPNSLSISYKRYKSHIQSMDVWTKYREHYPWINTQDLSDADYINMMTKHVANNTNHQTSDTEVELSEIV